MSTSALNVWLGVEVHLVRKLPGSVVQITLQHAARQAHKVGYLEAECLVGCGSAPCEQTDWQCRAGSPAVRQ
jgi:hypothetical protein